VLALSLLKILPESPRYLAARKARWPELSGILNRMGIAVGPDTTFTEASVTTTSSGSIAALLASDLRRDTLNLVLAFMSCLLAIWMGFIWIPAMLTDVAVGFAQADASYALSLFNFGGVAGANRRRDRDSAFRVTAFAAHHHGHDGGVGACDGGPASEHAGLRADHVAVRHYRRADECRASDDVRARRARVPHRYSRHRRRGDRRSWTGRQRARVIRRIVGARRRRPDVFLPHVGRVADDRVRGAGELRRHIPRS
jgi:hypothetical protein